MPVKKFFINLRRKILHFKYLFIILHTEYKLIVFKQYKMIIKIMLVAGRISNIHNGYYDKKN